MEPVKYVPKPITEEVNITPVHPLANLSYLLAVVGGVTVAAYFMLGWVADILVNRIGPEMEVKIARQSVPADVLDRGINGDPRLSYSLELLNSMRTPEAIEQIPLRIGMIDSEQPNAGVFPGGYFVVTEGLFEAIETENALAFVMAHELGHFEHRDPLERMGRSLVFATLASALGIGSDGSSGVVSLTGELAALHYGRAQELAADDFALARVVEKYGHGGSSLEFFESILESSSDNRFTAYFSSHPLTRERIDRLKEIARRNGWSMNGPATPLAIESKPAAEPPSDGAKPR